jgi:hypothetical protein
MILWVEYGFPRMNLLGFSVNRSSPPSSFRYKLFSFWRKLSLAS